MTKYDLVIYGASGFTGQFVIEYVHRAAKEHQVRQPHHNMKRICHVIRSPGLWPGDTREDCELPWLERGLWLELTCPQVMIMIMMMTMINDDVISSSSPDPE